MKSYPKYLENLFFFCLLIPFFFTINGEIFTTRNFTNNFDRNIFNVPLPLSLFFISAYSIFLFIYHKKDIFKNITFKFAFIVFSILFLFNFVFGHYHKLIFIAQYFLPWLGLLVGYFFWKKTNFNIIFYFLILIYILQIFNCIIEKKIFLLSDFYFFSIYQHYQYVVVVFVFLSIITSLNLSNNEKFKFFILNFLTLIVSILSYSLSAILFQLFFIFFYLFKYILIQKKINFKILLLLISISVILVSYILIIKNLSDRKYLLTDYLLDKDRREYHTYIRKMDDVLNFKTPPNITLRLEIWSNYFSKITNNYKILLFGSEDFQLDNQSAKTEGSVNMPFKSAHNLFLDLIYRFGILSITPYILLIFNLCNQILKNKNSIFLRNSLFFLVIFLLLENFIKLPLRQPYSGLIIMFFCGYFLKDRS